MNESSRNGLPRSAPSDEQKKGCPSLQRIYRAELGATGTSGRSRRCGRLARSRTPPASPCWGRRRRDRGVRLPPTRRTDRRRLTPAGPDLARTRAAVRPARRKPKSTGAAGPRDREQQEPSSGRTAPLEHALARSRGGGGGCARLASRSGSTEDGGAQSRRMRLMTRSSLKITATTFVGSLLAVSAALVAVQASRAGGTAYLRCPIWVKLPSANAHTSVSYIPRGVAVGPTRARVTATVAPAVGAIVVVQYGRGSSYLACSAGASRRARVGSGTCWSGRLLPDTSYRFPGRREDSLRRRIRQRPNVTHPPSRSRSARGRGRVPRGRRHVE